MKNHDGIFSKIAASTKHTLRTASGCLLVLAMSVANASNVGALPAPQKAAAIGVSAPSVVSPGDRPVAAVPAVNHGALLCAGFDAHRLSATPSTRRRLALGGGNLPAREFLKTARLQVPSDIAALGRPSSRALADALASIANRQRAP